MRTIQEIFDVVIDGGFYKPIPDENSSNCMCISLKLAEDEEVITPEEELQAIEEINDYLSHKDNNSYLFLATALIDNNLPGSFEDRVAIYRNWANRPSLSYGV